MELMRNIVISVLLVVATAFCGLFLSSSLVYAQGSSSSVGSATGTCPGDDADFLSFPTWYRGLSCDSEGKIDLQGGEVGPLVFTIALNVLDIMLRLAGILAVGFVIWGGIRYVLARGEPENAKKAQSTIMNAVIGLAVAMAATVLVGFLVWGLSRK